MPEMPELSIVLPARNEGAVIEDLVGRVDKVAEQTGLTYELIVVDDGSVDDTKKRLGNCIDMNSRLRLVSYEKNIGKGYAVKTGFFNASGDFVVFMDSDLEIDPTQIRNYVEALENGDLVIASKKHPDSRVEMPILRRFLSFGFNVLVRLLTGLRLRDTQSGLKAVRRESLEKVFSVLSVKRFAFDVELLAVANVYGMKVVEMPVNIRVANTFFGPKEILRMFIDLLGITYRLRVKKHYFKSKQFKRQEPKCCSSV